MRNRPAINVLPLLLAAAVAAAAILAGCSRMDPSSSAPPGSDTAQSGHAMKSSPQIRGLVRLTGAQVKQFGIETRTAGPGHLRIEVTLPGEVALNADRVAHVVPRVSGVVREVRKNLGDTVRRGEIMAVLESRELADSRAALLAARERALLAQSNFTREERLWLKKISAEQDYIQAKNSLAEAGIEVRTAEQKLRALGFSDDYIAQLSSRQDRTAILYEITAPFDATVTDKHISLGEVLKEDTPAFIIADLSSVWVNLDVHQKNLPMIRVGQKAVISVGGDVAEAAGRVSFLEPVATETNRTIHARVVIANIEGRYRPGLFVSGRIAVEDLRIPILVPSESLVIVDAKTGVFATEGENFRLQAVTTGRTNGALTEIVEGLRPGQVYVAKGAFTLKSELEKPESDN